MLITVLKGQVKKGAKIGDEGPLTRYRERDEIREVSVDLDGKRGPEGASTRAASRCAAKVVGP